MNKKPIIFRFVAFLMVAISLSFPIQAFVVYGYSLSELGMAFQQISFLNWICVSTMLLCGWCVHRASPHVRWVAPITFAVVALNNLVVGTYGTDFSLATTMSGALGFGLVFLPLVTKEARFVLSNPRNRWWLRAERIKRQLPATLNPYVGSTIQAEVFDISSSGAFIHVEDHEDLTPQVGDKLRLSINVGGFRNVKCEAQIVRLDGRPKGVYPTGMGLSFKNMDRQSFKDLQRFLRS